MTTCKLCQICESEPATHRGAEFAIMPCAKCGGTLLVFKQHGKGAVSVRTKLAAEAKAKELFGERYMYLNTYPKLGDKHAHWHVVAKREGEG